MSDPNPPFPTPPGPGSGPFVPPPPPSYGRPGPEAPGPHGQPAYGQPTYGQPTYGQPGFGQPGAGIPGPPGGPHRSGRNGMAIAGFVLGLASILLFVTFVVPVLAIVFGLLGARAIKRSGGRLSGLGMARAGSSLGALGLVACIAVYVAVIVDRADDTETSVDDLTVGACYDLPNADSLESTVVSTIDEVPCDEPHTGELFHEFDMNPDRDRDYPGEEDTFFEAADVCTGDPWIDFVGIDYQESVYEIYVIIPIQTAWKANRGGASCFVVDAGDELLTESVADSGR